MDVIAVRFDAPAFSSPMSWAPISLLSYFSQSAWKSYLRVIYVWVLWVDHYLLRLADLRTQHLVQVLFIYLWQFTFRLLVGIVLRIIRCIYGNWSNHMYLTITYYGKFVTFYGAPNFQCLQHQQSKAETRLAFVSSFVRLSTPLCNT